MAHGAFVQRDLDNAIDLIRSRHRPQIGLVSLGSANLFLDTVGLGILARFCKLLVGGGITRIGLVGLAPKGMGLAFGLALELSQLLTKRWFSPWRFLMRWSRCWQPRQTAREGAMTEASSTVRLWTGIREASSEVHFHSSASVKGPTRNAGWSMK